MHDDETASPAVIRSYEPAGLEPCRGLWEQLTAWHRLIYDNLDIGGDDPGAFFDEHLARVGAGNIWVAEAGGRVVGMAGMIPGEVEAELEPLVVSETSRGLGIGRQLASTVIAEARRRGVQQLTVRPVARNQAALRFFHHMGFGILGRIELFMDFGPAEHQGWQPGERLAGCDFRV